MRVSGELVQVAGVDKVIIAQRYVCLLSYLIEREGRAKRGAEEREKSLRHDSYKVNPR